MTIMAIKTVTAENLAEFAASRGVTAQTETPPAAAEPTANPVKAEGTETISTAPEPTKGEPPTAAKPKNSVQARIDELTQEKRELDEFAQNEYEARLQAQSRIKELEQQLQVAKPAEPAKQEPEAPRPDRTKYSDAEKYENDLLEWNRKQALKDFQREDAARREQEAKQVALTAFAGRIEAAREVIPDYDEVIRAAARRQEVVPKHVAFVLEYSDYGPQIGYELAKDRELAKRIFGMNQADAMLELGEIKRKYVSAEKAAKATAAAQTTAGTQPATTQGSTQGPHTTTRAPAPLPPITGGNENVQPDLSQPMPFAEYKRAKLAQQRQRRGRH
jgi:hypothetical protein